MTPQQSDEMGQKGGTRLREPHEQAEQVTTPRRPIWERAAELAAEIPQEERDRLPIDGAEQHDHYIYGKPKRTA